MGQLVFKRAPFGAQTCDASPTPNPPTFSCHAGLQVFAHQKTQPEAWEQAAADKAAGRPIDWAAVLGGYTACVDWPSAIVYKELLAANPKVETLQ